jgi:hypothetical protein
MAFQPTVTATARDGEQQPDRNEEIVGRVEQGD